MITPECDPAEQQAKGMEVTAGTGVTQESSEDGEGHPLPCGLVQFTPGASQEAVSSPRAGAAFRPAGSFLAWLSPASAVTVCLLAMISVVFYFSF